MTARCLRAFVERGRVTSPGFSGQLTPEINAAAGSGPGRAPRRFRPGWPRGDLRDRQDARHARRDGLARTARGSRGPDLIAAVAAAPSWLVSSTARTKTFTASWSTEGGGRLVIEGSIFYGVPGPRCEAGSPTQMTVGVQERSCPPLVGIAIDRGDPGWNVLKRRPRVPRTARPERHCRSRPPFDGDEVDLRLGRSRRAGERHPAPSSSRDAAHGSRARDPGLRFWDGDPTVHLLEPTRPSVRCCWSAANRAPRSRALADRRNRMS